MTAIRADNLSKLFGSTHAVRGLSLEVRSGELFGLLGPDGAGKTTTMRMLASIMDPDGGDAWVGGYHVVREADEVKRVIAYVGQAFGLYPDLSVDENIEFFADLYGVPRDEREPRKRRLLEFSNLAPFRARMAGALSGGMKQKLAIACALIHTPKIVLLDQPTSGVDPLSRNELWKILYDLVRDGVTIFVTTAYMDEAERFHRVALMHEGRALACGTPSELKSMLAGVMLEVRTTDGRRAAASLRAAFPRCEANLFGNRVHLLLHGERPDALPSLRATAAQALLRAGLEAESIEPIAPELEDVFLSMIGSER
jgi:ABC-2 type transport system ATP-binding protein